MFKYSEWAHSNCRLVARLDKNCECIASVLQVYCKCIASVSRVYCKCIASVLQVYCECIASVLRVHCECIASVLRVYCECIASVSFDKTIKVWNVQSETNECLSILNGHTQVV